MKFNTISLHADAYMIIMYIKLLIELIITVNFQWYGLKTWATILMKNSKLSQLIPHVFTATWPVTVFNKN